MGKSKFTIEEKLVIIKLNLDDGGSVYSILKKYKMGLSTLKKWIRRYKIEGFHGLKILLHRIS